MIGAFTADLNGLLADLESSRAELVSAVQRLADADLGRARRGGWPINRVLEHVIQSEHLYARLVYALRGQPVPEPSGETGPPRSIDGALCRLDESRRTLLSAVEGVDEDHFYQLRTFGHEEYSVISVLENAAAHDHEHAGQVKAIFGSA
jgi:hypothetical protein